MVKHLKKVFYNGSEYKFCKDIGDYRRLGWEHCLIIKDIFKYDSHFHNSLYNIINDTVEILPEENDEWEDIEELAEYTYTENYTKESIEYNRKVINQLIKNQKYLKERLDNVKDDVVFDYWKDKVVGKDE
ncbi:hypothetical protein [uncultured Rikenella sp.]|uniref:hypothetical protein n=1 Tax=uncultured Rikenella sp. TaxID=368003 RepID=UPI00261E4336|nr:hypothetical protein [uncultured Rikenella sp.]